LTQRHHLASLDAFRGITVAGMILVNNPGNWNSVFEGISHADWNGCTFADVVFPFFIFILGAAMPFAFARRLEGDSATRDLYARIVRRAVYLIALGLVLNFISSMPMVAGMRIPGVLQRIAVVYVIAAILVLHLGPMRRTVLLIVLVLGHWALLTLVPFGGGPAGLARAHNLSGFVDIAVFGRHILNPWGDPEGLLGTIPAVATALMGSVVGEWLRRHQSEVAAALRPGRLMAAGVAAAVAGILWARTLPLNKALWTGSFVMWTGGLATLSLAGCYLLLDVLDRRGWAAPFLWLGFNPLAVYFLSELFGDLSDKPWLHVGGQTLTFRSWLFWDVLRPFTSIGDEWLSLLVAVATVTIWIAVARFLYVRKIRIQV
jgi:predicted acyltransferase